MSSIPGPSSVLRTPRASIGIPSANRKSIGPGTLPRPSSRAAAEREFEDLMNTHSSSNSTSTSSSNGHYHSLSKSLARKPSGLNLRGPLEAGGRGTPPTPRSAYSLKAPKTPSSRPPPIDSTQTVTPGPAKRSDGTPKIGDTVSGAGMEGMLKFLGSIQGKTGSWAGISLEGTEWEGKGKNDGSAAGYGIILHVPPQCGIFVPAMKIALVSPGALLPLSATSTSTTSTQAQSPLASRPGSARTYLPPPPIPPSTQRAVPKTSAEAARAAQSRITEGSRASKYIGMTAAQLSQRPPRPRPSSPEKSMSPTRTSLGSSVSASTTTTPRAPRARPSLGPPLTGRKSISGLPGSSMAGATPRKAPALARPASAAGRRSQPDVPPLPNGYRSQTPSAASRRGAESRAESRATDRESLAGSVTNERTPGRRYSMAPLGASTATRPDSAMGRSMSRASVFSVDRSASEEKAEREKELRELKAQVARLEQRAREAAEEKGKLEEAVKSEKVVRERVERAIKENNAEHVAAQLAEVRASHEVLEKNTKAAQDELKAQLSTREADLQTLRQQLETALASAESERTDLSSQLDELRTAGQALCEVYEEKISFADQARMEAEEVTQRLEAELRNALAAASDGGSGSGVGGHNMGRVNEAVAIDNESLRADLKHARDRLGEVQEQFEEAKEALEKERERTEVKVQERGDAYTKVKDELRKTREEVAAANGVQGELKARVAELEGTLADAKRAQENERVELEALRGEASVAQEVGHLRTRLEETSKALVSVKEELKKSQAREKDLKEELDLVGDIKAAEADEVDEDPVAAKHRKELEARDEEIRSLRQRLVPHTAPTNIDTGSTYSLSPANTARTTATSPNSRKRDSTASESSKRSFLSGVGSPGLSRDEMSVMREQIVGLKSIIQQFNEERLLAEAEQMRLKNEAEDLKEANHTLENTVDKLMASASGGNTGAALPPLDRTASKNRLESDVGMLKAQVAELERKHNREVKSLNQEVSELESLVEAKIFREDELESEIAQYKSIIAALKASGQMVDAHISTPDSDNKRRTSRMTNGRHAAAQAPTRGSKTSQSSSEIERAWSARSVHMGGDLASPSPSQYSTGEDFDDDACELCGQPHRLEDCPIFGGTSGLDGAKAWQCSNCESDDHTSEECPHGDEVVRAPQVTPVSGCKLI